MNKKLLILFLLTSNFHAYLRATDESKNYKYIPPIEVKTSNQLLNTLINTNWDAKRLEKIIGKPDSYFLGYYLYFFIGISIGKTNDKYSKDWFNQNLPDGRVYNIIFNERYRGDILKRINLSSNKNTIIKKLGKPQFEDTENQVYGYKTKYFYIFFVGNGKLKEISVCKIDIDYDKSVIKKLLTKVKDKEGYNIFKNIMLEWKDYDYFFWHGGGGFVEYFSRGVTVGSGGEIRIKGNFTGEITDDISLPDKVESLKNFNNSLIFFELSKDPVFESELQRLQKRKKFEDRARKGEGRLAPDGKRRAMMNDHEGGWDAGLIIYYVNTDGPDKEIIFGFYGAKEWLNNRYLVLQESVTGMLHIYDILENNNTELDNNGGWQELISAKDGQIIYGVDDFNVKRTYTKSYTFDQDGKIIIK